MRVSDYYDLDRKQGTLDFVDVDIRGDVRVWVDPTAVRLLPSEWGHECVSYIQTFFQAVLDAVRAGHDDQAQELVAVLTEPNEVHLGLSTGKARGRALGPESSKLIWKALSRSEAVRSGLLRDLEDTLLMIEGIGTDIISDITVNILRGPLIKYTQDACQYYGISMEEGVASGPLWDPESSAWTQDFVTLPVTSEGKLLLVPKSIVRRRLEYSSDEYYNNYLLEHLQGEELKAGSGLVQILKSGRRVVRKNDLKEKYGQGKLVIVEQTLKHPDVLKRYRADKEKTPRPPLTHHELADAEGDQEALPDWSLLLDAMRSVPAGKAGATDYENTVEALLSALFYPSLSGPQKQTEIHEGRKRIDITYSNIASSGFFAWVAQHYIAPMVFVECKNYSSDPANPELDQLTGRFSRDRGKFGILVCRQVTDRAKMDARCKDAATDGRGFVVVLDDTDLEALVQARLDGAPNGDFTLLDKAFRALIL